MHRPAPAPGLDRRSFLGAAAAVPLWFGARGLGAFVPRGDDRTLLVLELIGGNDGLNTVVPVGDARYAELRPKLSAVRRGALPLADGMHLHPALARLHRLVGEGSAAVVHGVGYPQPDRSHFRSRDIWHVADPQHQRVSATTTGWLGRAADLLAARAGGVVAAEVGGLEVPLLLRAHGATVPALRRIEDFHWLRADGDGAVAATAPTRALVAAAAADADAGRNGRDGLRAFVARRGREAVALADRLSAALARYRPAADYPDDALGRDLVLAAQLVVSGFGTRLLHVGMPGFDTHARQLPTHDGLLRALDAALAAFHDDLAAHGKADRVVVFVHSEFGRRAAENASQGTDHGAAAPVFALGGGVRHGPLGAPPDLTRLDDGDVAATLDFRRLYAELLAWLEIDPAAVLGAAFEPAGLWA